MQEQTPFQKKFDPFIICVSSDKGGVGKTFTAENIAYLTSLECKVLVIDLDLQANLTSTYYIDQDPEGVKGSETIFGDEPYLSFVPARINGEDSKTLFVSVVNSRFGAALNAANGRPGVERLLEEAIRDTDHDFAVIIVDTPPAPRSIQKNNALSSAHMVLSVVTDDVNSFQGCIDLAEAVSKINDNNPTILVIQNKIKTTWKRINSQSADWGGFTVNEIAEYKERKGHKIKPFQFILLDSVIPEAADANEAHNSRCPVDLYSNESRKSTTNAAQKELLKTIKGYM